MVPNPALVGALRADLARTGVFVDYDGTLSPIVVDPEAAVLHPAAAEVLLALAPRVGRLAVVSGRPVSFLARHLPPGVDAVGLYGLESLRSGEALEHPLAAEWRPVVEAVAVRAVAELPVEVGVEHKGLSLTLHVRRHPAHADAAWAWAEAVSATSGLRLRPAKHSVELHPPVEVDKGTVVDELTAGLAAACYVGDDAGDLSAFAGLGRFAASGGTAVRVAVESDETPEELLAASDVRVPGPDGAIAFLRSLL